MERIAYVSQVLAGAANGMVVANICLLFWEVL